MKRTVTIPDRMQQLAILHGRSVEEELEDAIDSHVSRHGSASLPALPDLVDEPPPTDPEEL